MFSGTPTAAVVLQNRSERNIVVSMLESAGLTVIVYEDINMALVGSALPDFDITVVSSDYLLDYSDLEKPYFGAQKLVLLLDFSQCGQLLDWSGGPTCKALTRPVYRSELLAAVVQLLGWEPVVD